MALAIMDIGKSNAKLSIVNAETGALMLAESVSIRVKHTPCYPHLDTNFLWQWYLAALKNAQRRFAIETICVTAHGATAALIDQDELVLPVLDYEYSGPDELAGEYDQRCDPFSVTYSPKLPGGLNLGRQLYWQRQQFPDEFAQAHHLLPYAQYWSWLLCGEAAAEVTAIGSHTDLWWPDEKRFSDFAQREGFDVLLPRFKPCNSVLGRLKPELASKTNISTDCEVLVGVHDSNASLVPWLKTRQSPFTVMSTGTWVIIFSVGAALSGMTAERDCAANVNIHGEPVACARFMGGREFALVASGSDSKPTQADLNSITQKGIFALPSFTDSGGPFPGCVGRILSTQSISAAEQFALASLYCALLSDISLDLCYSQGDIIVEGAYARNSTLLACLQAFRPQQQVYASADTTGTTTGVAMLVNEQCLPPELQSVQPFPTELVMKLHEYRQRWREHCENQP